MPGAVHFTPRVLRRDSRGGARGALAEPENGEILVRPVRSEDEDGLRGMLSRLSPEAIYLRFHAPYPRVPAWAVAAFADAATAATGSPSLRGGRRGRRARHVRALRGRVRSGVRRRRGGPVAGEGGGEAAPPRARREGQGPRGRDLHRRRARGEPAHARPDPFRVRRGRIRDRGRRVPGQRAAAFLRARGPRIPGCGASPRTFGLYLGPREGPPRGSCLFPMPAPDFGASIGRR